MPQIKRQTGGKLDKMKQQAEPQMIGMSMPIYATPYRYVDRTFTPSMIRDAYNIPIIFSSLSFHNSLCFAGKDFKLESIDGPEDDTKQPQIDQALRQIKRIDKNLARIGKNRNCNTLDCLRKTSLETMSYRQSFWEIAVVKDTQEPNLFAPRLQHLPSASFDKQPSTLMDNTRYKIDEILKGVVFDTKETEAHFYQNVNSSGEPVEIPAEQIVYIEDKGVPENTSLLHSVLSTIEFLKQARHDFRLALARVGVPMKVAEIDGLVLARMKDAGMEIKAADLETFAKNMIVGQSTNQAEYAIPGIRFKYPVIPVALDPMAVEKFIEQIIISHFFAKNITEQLQQAVSVSAAPGKALLDGVISGHQEMAANPFEMEVWQKNFLDLNGYDLTISINCWSWSPTDQKAEADKAIQTFGAGLSLINDARAALELDAYTPEQIIQLLEEQNALKNGVMPGTPAGAGAAPQEPKKKGELPKPAPLPAA
jgi:hypothetical protein